MSNDSEISTFLSKMAALNAEPFKTYYDTVQSYSRSEDEKKYQGYMTIYKLAVYLGLLEERAFEPEVDLSQVWMKLAQTYPLVKLYVNSYYRDTVEPKDIAEYISLMNNKLGI